MTTRILYENGLIAIICKTEKALNEMKYSIEVNGDTFVFHGPKTANIIAPQAPFEESATTEASRRCPLTGFLREFRVLFWGHVLEVFVNGICVLAVQNTTPELVRMQPLFR